MANVKMDDSNLHSLGYTTKTALIKLRDDIRNMIEEHKKKNTTGYVDVVLYYLTLHMCISIFFQL